jgi:hypothetical protein
LATAVGALAALALTAVVDRISKRSRLAALLCSLIAVFTSLLCIFYPE